MNITRRALLASVSALVVNKLVPTIAVDMASGSDETAVGLFRPLPGGKALEFVASHVFRMDYEVAERRIMAYYGATKCDLYS